MAELHLEITGDCASATTALASTKARVEELSRTIVTVEVSRG